MTMRVPSTRHWAVSVPSDDIISANSLCFMHRWMSVASGATCDTDEDDEEDEEDEEDEDDDTDKEDDCNENPW